MAEHEKIKGGQNHEHGIVNILLVEDSPGDIRLTREAFKDAGDSIRLHVVTNGEDALDFLRQQGSFRTAPHPNLVLLDLNLPRKNGREVLTDMKNDPVLKRIPVIILTTSQAEEDILISYNLHANCYLTKPVDLKKFVNMVNSLQNFWFTSVKLPDSGKE